MINWRIGEVIPFLMLFESLTLNEMNHLVTQTITSR